MDKFAGCIDSVQTFTYTLQKAMFAFYSKIFLIGLIKPDLQTRTNNPKLNKTVVQTHHLWVTAEYATRTLYTIQPSVTSNSQVTR